MKAAKIIAVTTLCMCWIARSHFREFRLFLTNISSEIWTCPNTLFDLTKIVYTERKRTTKTWCIRFPEWVFSTERTLQTMIALGKLASSDTSPRVLGDTIVIAYTFPQLAMGYIWATVISTERDDNQLSRAKRLYLQEDACRTTDVKSNDTVLRICTAEVRYHSPHSVICYRSPHSVICLSGKAAFP